jgi:hypothetical protein
MKRRTRRRIVRTTLTCAALGLLVAMACWHRWRSPMDEQAVASAANRNRQIASCEDQIRPRLQGTVEGWRLVDEQASGQVRQFTFAANFNENRVLYHCEASASDVVLAVEGPE